MSQPVDNVNVAITFDTSQALARLRAAVDGAAQAISRELAAAFNGVEVGVNEATAAIGTEFTVAGAEAETALRGIGTQAQQSFDKVTRQSDQAASSIATKFGGALKLIGGLSLAALTAGLGKLTLDGLKSAASLEQTQISFDSLVGSAAKGKAVFDGLKQFAAATPFELTDLTGIAQRFLAFDDAVGLTDDQLQQFLTTVGNVVSVTGGGGQALNSVALAMGQISSAGKLTLDNLNQISEALPGFSGVAAIAASRGESTATVMKEISSGTISAKDGIQALLDGMAKFPGAAGAMEKQSQTLLGVFSTFKDTVSQALAGAFDPVIPQLKNVLTQVTPIIGDALTVLAPTLGDALTTVLAVVGPLIEPLAAIISNVITALVPFVTILGKLLLPIVQALEDPIAQLGGVLTDLAPSFALIVTAFLPLVPALGDLLSALIPLLVPLLKLTAVLTVFLTNKAVVPLVLAMAAALEFAAQALAAFGGWLTGIDWAGVGRDIEAFFGKIGDFFTGTGDMFSQLPDKIGKAIGDALDAIGRGAEAAAAFVRTLPGRIIGTLIASIAAAIRALANIDWGAVLISIVNFVIGVDKTLLAMFASVEKWLESLPEMAGKAFLALAKAALDNAGKVLDWLKDLPAKILHALGSLAGTLRNAGKDLVHGLWEGISSLGGWLWNQIKSWVSDNITQAFKSALGISSPSTVMRDAVGAHIPTGIAAGVEDGAGPLRDTINALLVPAQAATGSGGGGVTFMPGAIIMQFSGAMPTPAQAMAVGEAAGNGVARSVSRQRTNSAVRAI